MSNGDLFGNAIPLTPEAVDRVSKKDEVGAYLKARLVQHTHNSAASVLSEMGAVVLYLERKTRKQSHPTPSGEHSSVNYAKYSIDRTGSSFDDRGNLEITQAAHIMPYALNAFKPAATVSLCRPSSRQPLTEPYRGTGEGQTYLDRLARIQRLQAREPHGKRDQRAFEYHHPLSDVRIHPHSYSPYQFTHSNVFAGFTSLSTTCYCASSPWT